MIRTSVRARLSLWHSGLLALLVTAFAVASYGFLRRTELARIDSMLREQSEIVTQAMTAASAGGNITRADRAQLLGVMHDLRARGLRAWVIDAAGRPAFTTAIVQEGEGAAEERRVLGDTLPAAVLGEVATLARARVVGRTIATTSARARLYGAPLPTTLGTGAVVVSTSIRDLDALLANARDAAIAAVLVALLLSALAGYVLARKSLSPVIAMSRQADRIGAANLHERLLVSHPHDELGRLATTFNRLLDRVADAFTHQRRFMADASHELRTPVAILRGEADVTLSSDERTREDYRDALVVVRDAADRLSRTVNDIFLLARVDASQVPSAPAPVYLDELVNDTCRTIRSLAAQRGIKLVCDTAGEISYVGDTALLERLVMNLVDNAIKYSDDGGTVSVRLARGASGIDLTVENGGRGSPRDAQGHVFDRFFRADTARTHAGQATTLNVSSGSGLGLAIAKWIAELHGGRVDLTSSMPGRTVFTFRLPIAPQLRDGE
ncbi:MAG: sensor histidine kinase [Gemmatimonadales bacterium]